MYLYEMHCHNKLGSRCGTFTTEEIATTYKRQGFDGIVVTDHFFNGNCAVDYTLPWKERVEAFYSAYEEVKKQGDRVGLKVFFAFEYTVQSASFKDSMAGTDFLIYGLGKEWLLSKDEAILDLSVNDFMKMVKDEGGFVIQAHPYRLEQSYMNHISLFPMYTDGVEVLNTAPNTMGRPNRLAKKYAKEYGFYQTAGSDAHGNNREYFAVLKTKKPINSIEEMIVEIKAKRTKLAVKKNKCYTK